MGHSAFCGYMLCLLCYMLCLLCYMLCLLCYMLCLQPSKTL